MAKYVTRKAGAQGRAQTLAYRQARARKQGALRTTRAGRAR